MGCELSFERLSIVWICFPEAADTGKTHDRVAFAIDVDRAAAALGDAAPKLGAGHAKLVADDPEQRHVRGNLEIVARAIDGDRNHRALAGSVAARRGPCLV
jgi:hypothetical protein